MFQAIETKFYGPTNSRGARIRAAAQASKKFYDFDYGADDPHTFAAQQFAEDMGWSGTWVGGGNADGTGSAYVRLPVAAADGENLDIAREGCDWFRIIEVNS